MLATLDAHRRKEYVSPRVLQQTINYLTQGYVRLCTWMILYDEQWCLKGHCILQYAVLLFCLVLLFLECRILEAVEKDGICFGCQFVF